MKRTLHVINSILCVALMRRGILIIVCNRDANEDWMSIFTIVGGIQIVLAFVMFLIGALLPKDGIYFEESAADSEGDPYIVCVGRKRFGQCGGL